MKKIAPDVVLGKDVVLNDFVNLYGCTVGEGTKMGPFVEVQKNASIGCRCKIQSHTFICEGVVIEDEVFVGHGVVFINDRYPMATEDSGRLQTEADWKVIPTRIRKRASIGSNATILCGVTVGEGAIVGAGSVVVKDVPEGAIVAGNPAKVIRRNAESGKRKAESGMEEESRILSAEGEKQESEQRTVPKREGKSGKKRYAPCVTATNHSPLTTDH